MEKLSVSEHLSSNYRILQVLKSLSFTPDAEYGEFCEFLDLPRGLWAQKMYDSVATQRHDVSLTSPFHTFTVCFVCKLLPGRAVPECYRLLCHRCMPE